MRHTSYLEVLQSVLVENVFNIHGLLASCLGALIWAFTILYHSSASAAAAPQVVTVWIVHGALTISFSGVLYFQGYIMQFSPKKIRVMMHF